MSNLRTAWRTSQKAKCSSQPPLFIPIITTTKVEFFELSLYGSFFNSFVLVFLMFSKFQPSKCEWKVGKSQPQSITKKICGKARRHFLPKKPCLVIGGKPSQGCDGGRIPDPKPFVGSNTQGCASRNCPFGIAVGL